MISDCNIYKILICIIKMRSIPHHQPEALPPNPNHTPFQSYLIPSIIRYLLNIIPYLILVSNPSIIYHITGPITIPPFDNMSLIYWIMGMEFVRMFYTTFVQAIKFLTRIVFRKRYQINYSSSQRWVAYEQQEDSKIEWANLLTVKYLIIIIMKIFLIFSVPHRMKYYLHVFFIQLFILAINLIADILNNPKISQVTQIICVDCLFRISLFYQVTRTFNPNFGLYFFGNNLIILLFYQLYGSPADTLFVRHDVYRIFMVTFVYQLAFAIMQVRVSCRQIFGFFLVAYFFLKAIKHYQIMDHTDNNMNQNNSQNNNQNTNNNRNNNQDDHHTINKITYVNFFILIIINIVYELVYIYWHWGQGQTQNNPLSNFLLREISQQILTNTTIY